MEINHAEMVTKLVKPGADIAAAMTGEDANLLHAAIGISGEAGELLDAVKKLAIYRKPLDRENVLEELGDLEFYLEQMRQATGFTREEALAANIAKLRKRYEGLVYSDASAQARKDKEAEKPAELPTVVSLSHAEFVELLPQYLSSRFQLSEVTMRMRELGYFPIGGNSDLIVRVANASLWGEWDRRNFLYDLLIKCIDERIVPGWMREIQTERSNRCLE